MELPTSWKHALTCVSHNNSDDSSVDNNVARGASAGSGTGDADAGTGGSDGDASAGGDSSGIGGASDYTTMFKLSSGQCSAYSWEKLQ